MILHRSKFLIASSVVLFLIAGCASPIGTFFETRYQNVIGYFNTYYNAEKTFAEAEAEVLKIRPTSPDTGLYVYYPIPTTARTKFNTVIEKCSKIIQFYDQSKWVDDAILLIGKSYYHLNEMMPARKKFLELIENFPSSSLRLEAMHGLAKTYSRMREESQLHSVVAELVKLALEEGEEEIALEAIFIEGDYYFDQQNYLLAAKTYRSAITIEGDDEVRARIQYRLGRCLEFTNDHAGAAKAYADVLEYSPTFPVEYWARLRAGAMYASAGQFENARLTLDELRSMPLSNQEKPMVELELANIDRLSGNYEAAIARYEMIDTTYKRTDAAAKSYFHRAEMFEKKFRDFGEALIYYNQAVQENPQSEIVQPATEKIRVLSRYVALWNELRQADSLLIIATQPAKTFPVPDQRTPQIDSLQQTALSDTAAIDTSTQRLAGAAPGDTLRTPPPIRISVDSLHNRRAAAQFGLGTLFLLEFADLDSASYWLEQTRQEFPDAPFAARTLYALAEVHRQQGNYDSSNVIVAELIRRFPKSEFAESMLGKEKRGANAVPDPADSLYGAAESLGQLGDIRGSLKVLRALLVRYPESARVPQARYLVGWLFENEMKSSDSAAVHYRILLQEHPTSQYAVKVRAKLAVYDDPQSATTPEQPPPPPQRETKPPPTQPVQKDPVKGSDKTKPIPPIKSEPSEEHEPPDSEIPEVEPPEPEEP